MKTYTSAGGIVLNPDNMCALVFTDTLSWQFPKGTVEEGEELIDTAIREIGEETGITDLTLLATLPMYNRISNTGDHSRNIQYFVFRTHTTTLTAQAEISACKWVTLEEAANELTYAADKAWYLSVSGEVQKWLRI